MTEQLLLQFTRFKAKKTNVIYFSQVDIQMFSSNLHQATVNKVELTNTYKHSVLQHNKSVLFAEVSSGKASR